MLLILLIIFLFAAIAYGGIALNPLLWLLLIVLLVVVLFGTHSRYP